ncbi:MAG: flagellar FliL protein [Candidatus Tokpelaia sp. JSC188]|nr:MAG: flagellar FliL protein [Candidatus Tokpelaia sp. JSC188]
MVAYPSQKNRETKNERSDTGILIAAVTILTFLVGLGNWFIGTKISEIIISPLPEKILNKADKVSTDVITDHGNVVVLPPILTNLALPESNWIRVAISLVSKPKKKITEDMAVKISNDFLSYLRQCSLDSIKGSTGLLYLREDLLERANIRSGGKVSSILISSLVIEK